MSISMTHNLAVEGSPELGRFWYQARGAASPALCIRAGKLNAAGGGSFPSLATTERKMPINVEIK